MVSKNHLTMNLKYFHFHYIILAVLPLCFGCSKGDMKTYSCSQMLEGCFEISSPCNTSSGIKVQLVEDGKFIFNCNQHTITFSTNLDIIKFDKLYFDQFSVPCFIENPSFDIPSYASTYHVVEVENPDFWNCMDDEMLSFCYQIEICHAYDIYEIVLDL